MLAAPQFKPKSVLLQDKLPDLCFFKIASSRAPACGAIAVFAEWLWFASSKLFPREQLVHLTGHGPPSHHWPLTCKCQSSKQSLSSKHWCSCWIALCALMDLVYKETTSQSSLTWLITHTAPMNKICMTSTLYVPNPTAYDQFTGTRWHQSHMNGRVALSRGSQP